MEVRYFGLLPDYEALQASVLKMRYSYNTEIYFLPSFLSLFSSDLATSNFPNFDSGVYAGNTSRL